jgi:mycothione reductase
VTHYDLAVIGTGSGNTIVTEQFADWRVAILEDNLFGGTCLNVGCIPTKMFVYPADLTRYAGDGPALGVQTSYAGADWPAIRDRIFGRIDPIAQGGRAYREGLPNVDVYAAHATFVDDHTLDTGTGERITADQVVVAAGSRVDVAPVPGLEEVTRETGRVHTSDTIMRLEELPRRLTIIGGGFVAAEFAHVFSSLGTQVTQVHRGGALLQKEDEDVAAAFTRAASAQWDVRLGTTAEHVSSARDGLVVQLSDGTEVESDVLLMATGRIANADRLGLDNTGIALDDDIVKVDEYQRTSVEGVWALGDVANRHQLKHVANLEARTIQHNLLHPDDLQSSDHRFVPSAVFSHPQVASVGLTSQAAREQGVQHREATHDYADIAYGWAMETPSGEQFVKLLSDPSGERLLGAHVIGPQASNLIQPLIQAMSLGSRVTDVARGQYWIHPAMAEVVENALLKLVPE